LTTAPADLERFRELIGRRLGLQFEDARLASLGELLSQRAETCGESSDGYLGRLEAEWPRSEEKALAQALTVAETYFFRNADQWRALQEAVLPERLRAQASSKRLRILSAGCASGEEAYSLAIAVRELADPSWEVTILGLDINTAMIAKAREARYTSWALRETPPDVRQRWFRAAGREFLLSDSLREAVRFEETNLVGDEHALWAPASYDVVFCRNVLMYLRPERARDLVDRIARALQPGGYAFFGHAETLRGLSNDFHLCHTHDTFYYQRRPLGETAPRPSISASAAAEVSAPIPAPALDLSATWVEAIRKASERIHALVAARAPSSAGSAHWDSSGVLELVRQEQYARALTLLEHVPAASATNGDVMLLRAVLLTHGGRASEAESACEDLLAADELNAGAHYVMALCREWAGDARGSMEHDQAAAYLDPAFAMPRFHLGRLARRSGDRDTARRELGQALFLLEREEASRLLLFGGGFNRETLMAICRAELTAAGGAL
jgi:chemotaxis protein methyltransferase CheR